MAKKPPPPICPECQGVWLAGNTCTACFHLMLAWEFEHPEAAVVHHLTVLCYYLQHPSLYSPEGLACALNLLPQFLEQGKSPQAIRQQNRRELDSGNRDWLFKGSPKARGAYRRSPLWTVTVQDVMAGGLAGYPERVTAWARSVAQSLRASGNL